MHGKIKNIAGLADIIFRVNKGRVKSPDQIMVMNNYVNIVVFLWIQSLDPVWYY